MPCLNKHLSPGPFAFSPAIDAVRAVLGRQIALWRHLPAVWKKFMWWMTDVWGAERRARRSRMLHVKSVTFTQTWWRSVSLSGACDSRYKRINQTTNWLKVFMSEQLLLCCMLEWIKSTAVWDFGAEQPRCVLPLRCRNYGVLIMNCGV